MWGPCPPGPGRVDCLTTTAAAVAAVLTRLYEMQLANKLLQLLLSAVKDWR